MGKRRNWTKEEIDYLTDKWGTVSVPYIAKKLNRSEKSITIKAQRLKLGRFLENGDYITWNQLLISLGFPKSSTYKTKSWIDNREFPIKYKKVGQKTYKTVKIIEFWEWAEKNKSFLDFSKFIRYALGDEPSWVEEKRQHDIIKKSKFREDPWTQKDDEYLIFLVKQFKYNYQEVSERLCRTTGAINRRLNHLKIKERPLKAHNHNKWTEEELLLLDELIVEGMDYSLMSSKLNKSGRAIAATVFRNYGTEVLDRVREIILN